MYGWPASTVAAMTPAQQLMYLQDDNFGSDTDPRTGRPTITFNTAREHQAWLMQRDNG